MGKIFSLRMSAEAKIRLPSVDEALNLGYAFHAADNPDLKGSAQGQLAQTIKDEFLALKSEQGTAESAYLDCVRSVVHSHAGGITRRKRDWMSKHKDALEEMHYLEERIRESRKRSDWLSYVWRLLGPAILAISGYLFAQLLSPVVPEDWATHTGTKLPAIMIGLVFVFIGRSVGFWFYDLQHAKIKSEYNRRCYLADLAYEEGKAAEYDLYRQQLCEAWEQYTGEKYPASASYRMILAGDMAARKNLERQLRIYSQNNLRLFIRIVKWIHRPKRTNREAAGSVALEINSKTALP